MNHNDIAGRKVADKLLEQIAQDVATLKQHHWFPKLVSIKVGDDNAVDLYVRNQRRNADRVGIEFEERHYPGAISVDELTAVITNLNVDPTVTGIILQRPVPEHLPIKALQETIHPLKDVEGMRPKSIGNIVYGELELAPCTAKASVEILKSTGLSLEGLEACVIGHSEIVGKPIAFLLMAEGATVTVCHHMTREVAVHSRRADVVFVAVGKAGLLTGDMIKPGAVVVDIGINVVEGEDGKSKVVGDCDYESCQKTAGWITPVPGGVGPVTLSILMKNTVTAAQRLQQHYNKHFLHGAALE
ncbi:bifunctional 5,10-methylenetetrahydrofolate dehydrogenase/5,10-methenyltetrahydrofolate cyclohydrolase [Pontiella sp.]|uniref:bifunctional 5,10-methylenetetrahydrofolate dehydrogenase/5,10-methenyltetrahydrofolate cyclohydrolase n=1 Tax=Pontiella sp. TaxID=2837462 RepID=UPI00356342E5